MAAKPTTVYPLARTPNGQDIAGVPGVPHVKHVVETAKEAEDLEATGAFTTNANHADRLAEPDVPAEQPAAKTADGGEE